MMEAQNSSADTLDKDIELQSIHTDSSAHNETDIEEGNAKRDGGFVTITEKEDIEAYPDGVNDPQNEPYSGCAKEGAVTRTSTKSSVNDPGPPPDGGWIGWSQGAYVFHCVLFKEFCVFVDLFARFREVVQRVATIPRTVLYFNPEAFPIEGNLSLTST
jgi:hypothetical protein